MRTKTDSEKWPHLFPEKLEKHIFLDETENKAQTLFLMVEIMKILSSLCWNLGKQISLNGLDILYDQGWSDENKFSHRWSGLYFC